MRRGRSWWSPTLSRVRGTIFLTLACWTVALLIAMPLGALAVIAASGDLESLSHLSATVLPRSTLTTLLLLGGIAALTGSMGAICAWLVSFYSFPGRNIYAWALMLPLAVPTYISAYAFVEFFTFTGPVQTAFRNVFGFESARDYWFPDIRSLPGAVLVLSFVLYPYVFMSVRALFFVQGGRLIESARSMGAGPGRVFSRVLLPLARPAIALGITIALMEAINDIGAVEFLGVQTLTMSVFSVWLNQDDIAGAAQIALLLLILIFVLIGLERLARRNRRFVESRTSNARMPYRRIPLKGSMAALASAACLAPVALGFGVPISVLGGYALRYAGDGLDPRLMEAFGASIWYAALAAGLTVILALLLTFTVRVSSLRSTALIVRVASIGYAIPGTIIALGIFLPLARFDNLVDALFRDWLDLSTGLLITGSGATLVYAYAVRFMAVAEGSLDGGFKKLSPNLDMAARSLGRTRGQMFFQVFLPLLKPAIATAALLVFIDSLKELSATIMLRPFGVETVATYVYDLASRGRIEQAGTASIIIIVAGIVPVIVLARTTLSER